MKEYTFKSIEPFFSLAVNQLKTFDIRLFDYHDPRHRALVQFRPGRDWRLRFVNPATKEFFVAQISAVDYVREPPSSPTKLMVPMAGHIEHMAISQPGEPVKPRWLVIYFDQLINHQPCLKMAPCPPQPVSAIEKRLAEEE